MSAGREIPSRLGFLSWRGVGRWTIAVALAIVLFLVAVGSARQVVRQSRFLIDGVDTEATIVGEITCSSVEGGGTCTADVQYTVDDGRSLSTYMAFPPNPQVGDTIRIRHLRSSPELVTALAAHLQIIGLVANVLLLAGAVAAGFLLVRFLRKRSTPSPNAGG